MKNQRHNLALHSDPEESQWDESKWDEKEFEFIRKITLRGYDPDKSQGGEVTQRERFATLDLPRPRQSRPSIRTIQNRLVQDQNRLVKDYQSEEVSAVGFNPLTPDPKERRTFQPPKKMNTETSLFPEIKLRKHET